MYFWIWQKFSSKYKRCLSEFGSTFRESVFLNSTVNIERSPGSLGSSSLDELIEIQRGVSEKEFSIDEAERLYSAWKERNRSFKMSMKDRQKGLEEMRNTYAEVIHQAKARGERQSLFERIKSTFGGRKSSKEDIYQPKIKVFDNFFIFPLCFNSMLLKLSWNDNCQNNYKCVPLVAMVYNHLSKSFKSNLYHVTIGSLNLMSSLTILILYILCQIFSKETKRS